jgi:hypothetical protein
VVELDEVNSDQAKASLRVVTDYGYALGLCASSIETLEKVRENGKSGYVVSKGVRGWHFNGLSYLTLIYCPRNSMELVPELREDGKIAC